LILLTLLLLAVEAHADYSKQAPCSSSNESPVLAAEDAILILFLFLFFMNKLH
jgi:hypothetical protein